MKHRAEVFAGSPVVDAMRTPLANLADLFRARRDVRNGRTFAVPDLLLEVRSPALLPVPRLPTTGVTNGVGQKCDARFPAQCPTEPMHRGPRENSALLRREGRAHDSC